MKSRNLFQILESILFFLFLNSQLIAQQPPDAESNWTAAGLWTGVSFPSQANKVYWVNLMPGATWDAKVLAARDAAKNWILSHPNDWVIIKFRAGIYSLNSEINLDHTYRNIIFQGEGSNNTTLRFTFGGPNHNCFHIYGSDPEANKRSLSADLNRGQTTIQCSSSLFAAPCWIRLCEEDHPYTDEWARYSVGQITRLNTAIALRAL